MLDISVIILTYNEKIHIDRCIRNVSLFAKDVFLVDSFSNDGTIAIARSVGAKIFQNKWENNHAQQFNWALENLPITTEWILRLDADEYLMPDLIEEIEHRINELTDEISGVVFSRRHYFLGKWMKRGTYPVKLLRLFRYKKAFCEQRWMDEHIQLSEGKSVEFRHDFVDHNLNNLNWWIVKHLGYTIREAIDLLDLEFGLLNNADSAGILSNQAETKRKKKYIYARQPLFIRSFADFGDRYVLKLGFTEGKEAFLWHFLQGWWYRAMVDARIYEIKCACGNDKARIKEYIRIHYSIDI